MSRRETLIPNGPLKG
jgi:hypothetical protein